MAKLSVDKASVPFLYPSGAMMVRGTVNGRASANFLVDTGAGLTMIARATAKEVGIDLEKRHPIIPLQTIGGISHVPLVVLDSIEVGGMEVKNITVAVYDPYDPNNPGLLGRDFLSHFRVEIDLKAGLLLLERQ